MAGTDKRNPWAQLRLVALGIRSEGWAETRFVARLEGLPTSRFTFGL